MRFKRDGRDYLETVAMLRGRCVPLREFALPPTDRVYALRHDVDNRIDTALTMAELECEAGLESTYFLLNTAGYWEPSLEFGRSMARLHSLGREVGLHHAAVSLYVGDGIQPADSTRAALAFMREWVPVTMVCSHGDPLARRHGFTNYHAWTEFEEFERRHDREPVPPPRGCERVSLASLGIEYEAYFLGREAYISDSGGCWRVPVSGMSARTSHADLDAAIDRFNNMDAGRLCLLAHPCWWD